MKKALFFLIAAMTVVVGAGVAGGAYLANATLAKAKAEAIASRFAIIAERVANSAEQAAAMGIAPGEQSVLEKTIGLEVKVDYAIKSLEVADAAGVVLFSSEPDRVGKTFKAQGEAMVSAMVRDDLDKPIARVDLRYNDASIVQSRARVGEVIFQSAWPAVLAACAATALLGLTLGWLFVRGALFARPGRPRQRFRIRRLRASISTMAALVLCAALGWVGWSALKTGEVEILPDFIAKADSVATATGSLVERAVALGMPLEQLAGVPEHLTSQLGANPEVAGIALVSSDGRTLHQKGVINADDPLTSRLTLTGRGDAAGAAVLVAVNRDFLARRLGNSMLDIAFLGFVALLVSLELMALLAGSRGVTALADLEQRLLRSGGEANASSSKGTLVAAEVRPALFLFMLAEELPRPFLPSQARDLAPSLSWLSPEALASLPLVAFLATVALLQLPFAVLSERFTRRDAFITGAFLAALGYALAGWASSFGLFTGARVISAVGFALVFVAAQGRVVDGSTTADRARSLGIFVRAILVAGLCGPLLGGVIADRAGLAPAWFAAAGLAALAGVVAFRWLEPKRAHSGAGMASELAHLGAAWRTPGIPGLLLGCALPAKLILAALCFYLLPLEMQRLGYTGAEIGRMQVINPLLMVLAVPIFARYADRVGSHRLFVIGGCLVAGAGAWLVAGGFSIPAVMATLVLLGLGQAASITPQAALVTAYATQMGRNSLAPVLGLYRLVERSGSAVGPAVGGWLLALAGFGPAMAAIGSLVLVGCGLYALTSKPAPSAAAPAQTGSPS